MPWAYFREVTNMSLVAVQCFPKPGEEHTAWINPRHVVIIVPIKNSHYPKARSAIQLDGAHNVEKSHNWAFSPEDSRELALKLGGIVVD